MASELRFDTRVDLSGLNSGFAAATATVKSGASDMATAMAASKQAAQNLAEALAALGPSAQAGNAQAKAAIAEYTAAAEEARAAVDALRVSETEEGVVLQSTMSKRMAASAELRIFEGNLTGSTRAAGALLSTLPGLGEAMTAAFPLFGAVALGEVLVDVAGKVARIADEYRTLGAVGKATLDSLIEMDKRLVSSSAAVLNQTREQRVLDAESTGPRKGRGDRGAAAGAAFDAAQDTNNLAIAQSRVIDNQRKINELREQTKPVYSTPGGASNAVGGGGREVVNQDQINIATKLIEQHTNEQDANEKEVGQLQQKLSIDKEREALRQREAGEKEAPKGVDQGRLRSLEQGLLDEQRVHKLSEGEIASYWAQYLTTFKAGTSEYNTIERDFNSARDANSKKLHEGYKKATEPISAEGANEAIAHISKLVQEGAEDAQGAGEKWKSYWSEVAKGQEISTQNAASLQQAHVAAELVSGAISKTAAAQQDASIHAADFKAKLAELNTELARLIAQQKELSKDPMFGGTAGAGQLAGQIQGVKNQISTTQGQAAVSSTNDSSKVSQDISQPYITAFTSINNSWLQLQNKLIFGTKNVGQAFANMGVSMLETFAASAEKMVVKSLETDTRRLIGHQQTNTGIVVSDATAGASSTAIKQTEGLKQALIDAKSAAVAGWKAGWSMPFPLDLIMAPALASAGFAGAIAQFETGGLIPNTGMALVHQGEAVLPATFTNFLMNAAHNSSTSNSSSAAMTMNFHGGSNEMFRQQMTRNANHVVKTVSRGLRNMGKR